MRQRDRISVILAAILTPITLATIIAMTMLWPTGQHHDAGIVDTAQDYPVATVLSTTSQQCEGTNEDRLPDGTVPESVACLSATVEFPDGTRVDVWVPSTVPIDEVVPGVKVVLEHYAATGGLDEAYVFHDMDRGVPLTTLAAFFALVVALVGGWRGARAVVGLALAFVVIAIFMLPALLDGRNPVAVGLVGSSAIMVLVLYFAHGVSQRTSSALLGTLAGLFLTAGLGAAAARAAHLTGVASEEAYRVAQLTGQLGGQSLRGIFLAGLILAGLGVLNDVTITQASAVWELRASSPEIDRRTLFARGMRIGRDHMASTVYTIAFAYTGAALPVLLLLQVYRLPLWQTLSSGAFAEEIVRTLVGSIGLVLAIPLTTAIAVAVVTSAPAHGRRSSPTGHTHSHGHFDETT